MMRCVSKEFPVYEVRRSWTSRTILSVSVMGPIVMALVVVFVLLHVWLGLPFVALLICGLLGIVDGGLRKPVALRMDDRGITLTKALARTPTLVVPWPELRAIWLVRPNRFDAIGVTTTSAPDQPGRFFPMINWQVDMDRIKEILARYAPTAFVDDRLPRPKNASDDVPDVSGPQPTVQP
jgi:hypothetical protein